MSKAFIKNIFLIFIAAYSIQNIYAQNSNQMRVIDKPELLSGEIIASTNENRDRNGDLAAGLLIVSDLTGLTYDSNDGLIKPFDRRGSGEDLLYLSPKERVVTVYCTGYEPLRLFLYDLGIRLESGRVWQIRITGDKQQLDVIPINIITTPPGASITINGELKGTGTTHQSSAGTHQIRIEKEGFRTIEETIEVSTTSNLFNYNLLAIEPEKVSITSQPPGAAIFINNFEQGVTNRDLFLFPGMYKIKVSLSGYQDKEEEVEVKENVSNTFNYSLTKNIAALTLNITPTDATVKINREDYTNRKTVELPPGTYKIDISKEGYGEITEVVTLELGKPLTKNYTLRAITGSLQFTVQPTDAEVKLIKEGRTIESWNGSRFLRELQVGNYSLEASRSGFQKITKQITIKEKQTTVEDIVLPSTTQTAREGIMGFDTKEIITTGSSNTWNWIVTGLAVAGSAVAAYFYFDANSKYDKYSSSFNPMEASNLRTETEASAKLFNISISISSAAALASLILWLTN